MAESNREIEVKRALKRPKFRRKRIESLIRKLLIELQDDPDREGLIGTPNRVARMYEEILEGQRYTNDDLVKMFNVTFPEEVISTNALVVEKDISAFSLCEHHLALMYDMKISIGYIPNGRVIGLSKLNRIVDLCAKRLQLQEKLGKDIAYVVSKITKSPDVAVYIEGKHACVTSRGIRDKSAVTRTSSLMGKFETNEALRAEFMTMIK